MVLPTGWDLLCCEMRRAIEVVNAVDVGLMRGLDALRPSDEGGGCGVGFRREVLLSRG